MHIIVGIYDLYTYTTYVSKPLVVVKETNKCYWTGSNTRKRILKEEIGIVRPLSSSTYPYLEVIMIDATEIEIKEKLAEWFEQKANNIRK